MVCKRNRTHYHFKNRYLDYQLSFNIPLGNIEVAFVCKSPLFGNYAFVR